MAASPRTAAFEVELGPLDQRQRRGPDAGFELAALDLHGLDLAGLAVEGRTQHAAFEVDTEVAEATAMATGDLCDQLRRERDHGHELGSGEIATFAVGESELGPTAARVKLEGVEAHEATVTSEIDIDK